MDANKNSVLRDIMSDEGFELTDSTEVMVNVIPSKGIDEGGKIVWDLDQAQTVVTLTNPEFVNGKSAEGTYGDMTLTAKTFFENPDSGKKDLHTVDVTGFDYKSQYVAEGHPGSKLQVVITGVKALPGVTTDQKIYTNDERSGIWTPKAEGSEQKAKFPEKPQTYMPSKAYIMDYAKTAELNLDSLKMSDVMDVDADGYNPFDFAAETISQTYGDAAIQNDKLTYTPKNMNWNGYDTFYVFGKTEDKDVLAASANANGNVWGKVSVIPANNVYFEDDFITDGDNGTVGIEYTGSMDAWQTAGESSGNAGSAEDGVQGWIPALNGETGDTDGSSHHADVTGGKTASASFTFTGTGVDVYSRTNNETGTIVATLADEEGNVLQTKVIDTKSASGEYFQVPTLSFMKQGEENSFGEEPSQGEPLPYGTYTVTLQVTTAAAGRYQYYLDGIRVYNPLNTGVPEYGDEMNASFVEVRDLLLNAGSFNGKDQSGVVFIDEITGTDFQQGTIETYEKVGPENEVYLSKGETISFKVDQNVDAHYYVGLKALSGDVTCAVSGSNVEKAVSHSADMYYEVAPADDGFITITNNGDGILAITKLKVTSRTETLAVNQFLAEFSEEEVLNAVQAFQEKAEDYEPEVPDVDIQNPDDPDESENTIESPILDILDAIFGGFHGWFRP